MSSSERTGGRGDAGHPAAEGERSAWQRWEMRSLSGVRGAAAADRPAIDPAELRRLREQAREAGAAEGRREGLAQGQAEGYAAGLAAGQAAVQEQAARLGALAQALPQALQRLEGELATTLVALALDVARQVVHRTFEAEPQWIVPLVQDLLHAEPALQGDPRLLLHPDDIVLVTAALGPQLQDAGWHLRADDAIGRGGCTVLAASGSQDATLETRWQRVIAPLRPADVTG